MANKCKFEKEQFQVSYNSGATWENVIPEQFRKGELLEYSSPDCSGINTLYRWRVLEGQYLCDGTSKYVKEIQDESYDGGITWYTSYPTVYRTGQYIGVDVDFCTDKFIGHYISDEGENEKCPKWYKWNGYMCVYVDPLKVLKCDNNSTLTSTDTIYYSSNYTLITAEIGDCVTSIGNYAFQYCYSLTSCTIGSGVTSIGYQAFQNCTSLTSITIPNNVTTVGSYAFSYCTSLTSIDIPSGVTTIGDMAFRHCTNLTSITINAVAPPTLGGLYTFEDTNNCPIYVPADSVDVYKAASGWSNYTDRIQAIT